MPPSLTPEEYQRYSRHLLIPDVGLQGQLKLKTSAALVIGAGGLGSPVALYLAAAGVGRIGIVDSDVVDASNLQRQVLHGSSALGMPKVESARARLLDLNPHIQVDAYHEAFTADNAKQIASPYDMIIDCSDNFPTRYLSNDLCVLTGKPNIYGAIYRFDGQVSVFDAEHGPCYRCLFPEPPPPGLVPSCSDGGVLGVLPGVIGALQAAEAIKVLLGIGETLVGKLLLFNALDMSFDFIKLRKNPQCKVCGPNPEVITLIDYEAFCGIPGMEHPAGLAGAAWEISPVELSARLQRGDRLQLVDVREPHELEISRLPEAHLIPLGEIASRLDELDKHAEIVLFCRTGTRSQRALEILTGAGFSQARHLTGGINAWARDVDSSLPIY
ncbi:MAG TPA: molybdopterin-synthase adenylyltransferase MoeB [Anaerolineales bacterium]|nr:molybdopterin-synthase adenylyltransferase MoeB [Anaerolineales bacterium]